MTRFVAVPVAAGLYMAPVLLACPVPPLFPAASPEIFCDNFNTYCTPGGYPGGAGDPADPDCVSNTGPNNTLLRSVWVRTSTDESNATPCGGELIVDPSHDLSTPPSGMDVDGDNADFEDYQAISSFPFGARIPGRPQEADHSVTLVQTTLKDWAAPNPLTFSRLIQNAFGPEFTAVQGTDASPLVLSFFISGKAGPQGQAGRIWHSQGYVELAYGGEAQMNRANTDYALYPYGICPSAANAGPFISMCAIDPAFPPTDGVPANITNRCPPGATAPVHSALAVGALAQIDSNPCDTGAARGGTNNHPVLYNGKNWYEPRNNNPAPSSGFTTTLDGTIVTDKPELDVPGRFVFYGGRASATNFSFKDSNWLRLTIKTSTLKLEMRSRELANDGVEYYVYSVMDNIPRMYTGPFDRIRIGVGPGCELNSNTDWNACKPNSPKDPGDPPATVWPTARHCLDTNAPQAYHVDIDDLTIAGGVGYTERGACCHTNGACSDNLLPEECQVAGDQHGGANSQCSSTTCCGHGAYVWADADGDVDVDSRDFASFQRCYTGAGGPMSSNIKCACFDRDSDLDVDGVDFQEFIKCDTRSDVPWSPGLTPDCVQ